MDMIKETYLPHRLSQGKVRDTYSIDEDTLLMISTDRISAFDVILHEGIPGKGEILNKISQFWFDKTSHIIGNHLMFLGDDPQVKEVFSHSELIQKLPKELCTRSMVVRRAERIDVECIVRGYITGSAWVEYSNHGTVSGQEMPKGLAEGEKFPEPIFTPTTKAESGHDENMTKEQVVNLVGEDMAATLESVSKQVYNFAHRYAIDKKIILADTKMEFGLIEGELTLIDELLTPDSSRFWEADRYVVGTSLPNYDKQLIRDWLEGTGWDKESTPPNLPDEVIDNTISRYAEVYQLLKN